MTREEIRERAIEIVNETRGSDALPEDYGTVEYRLVALVSATLQEAARAACIECGAGRQISERVPGGRWMHVDHYGECEASEIHDLIAALDKEGS